MITLLLLPPASLMILIALGLWCDRVRFRFGRRLGVFALGLLYFFSVPLGEHLLAVALQPHEPIALDTLVEVVTNGSAEAIVVLAAGIETDAVEFGGDTVGPVTLLRLRYAALVARRTGLPVLVSGGAVGAPGHVLTEAELMARVLEEEFDVAVRWQESDSRNTYENARNSARKLAADGVRTIVLITHAVHMPRAEREFERQGLRVIAAPTMPFDKDFDFKLRDWIPSTRVLWRTSYALYEALGRVWYRWRNG